jgi:ribosome-associated translation inhibitor RaiA
MAPVLQKTLLFPDSRLQKQIEGRITRLMTFYHQIEFVDFNCWEEHRGHSTDKVCEIFVRMYKKDLFIIRKNTSLKKAALKAITATERRIAYKTGKRISVSEPTNPGLVEGYE